ncbi:hypothetical protein RRG08_056339 [Elysia crispata]|uniref:Uncharacterized protein n=1 Tax=Elysia crispata TaxID=231223 RepID=A0AAE0YPE6_9GAST|nr:hypothetical protein RRG08_056339 [Elysia crispata]
MSVGTTAPGPLSGVDGRQPQTSEAKTAAPHSLQLAVVARFCAPTVPEPGKLETGLCGNTATPGSITPAAGLLI